MNYCVEFSLKVVVDVVGCKLQHLETTIPFDLFNVYTDEVDLQEI